MLELEQSPCLLNHWLPCPQRILLAYLVVPLILYGWPYEILGFNYTRIHKYVHHLMPVF